MADKTKKKIRVYSQLTGKIHTIKRLHEVRERLVPKYSADGFMTDLLDVYEKAHCPECGNLVEFKTCSCKSPERM